MEKNNPLDDEDNYFVELKKGTAKQLSGSILRE